MRRAALVALLLAPLVGCAGDGGGGAAAGPPPTPLVGRVLDDSGAGVPGAEVCWIAGAELEGCVGSGPDGAFALPGPPRERFRVAAEGHHVRELAQTALDAPIVLSRSPVLVVRLVDGVTGEPIETGQVRVVLTSGRDFGPFPVNRAGVRVRRVLPPGDAIVFASAPGYGPVDPVPIDLEPGRETEVEIPLRPAG